jgi:hypothetical protein
MKAPTNYRNEIRKRTVRGAPQVGKHHGEGPSDGAQRNARIAAMNADRREQSRTNKETIIAKQTAAAEKRKKETLDMATEDSLTEAKHVFHVHMKSDDDRQHKMVDDKTSEPIGSKPKGVKLVVKVPAADTREARNKVSRHLAKNYGVSAVKSIEYKGLEEQASSGTEARTKIKNVARLNDAEPTSKESTLAKTGEIKTKKIDEGRSMSINRNFGLPESLIAATRALMEKKHDADDMKSIGKNKTEVDTKPTTDDQVNDGDESNVKKKTKKLDPVGKEDDDIDNDGDVDKSDKYLHGRRKAIKKSMKEDVRLDEAYAIVHKKTGKVLNSHDNKADADDEHNGLGSDKGNYKVVAGRSAKKSWSMKEEAEQIDELKKSGVLSRYINAVKHDVDDDNASPKRKAGYFMALKKKHGDKKYGFDEPRVKGTNEEAEQIDELKKSTLGSYVTKVAKLAPDQVKTSRREGIVKASQKLRKMDREDSSMKEEAEQIDELKKSTLASYVNKASNDATKHSYMAGKTSDVDKAAKASQRIRGVMQATNKLAKEEFSDGELARLEEIAAKFDVSEASTERGLQDHEPRIVSGVKGMKSKPFSKKFPHAKSMEKWMDSDDYGNHEVHRIEKA